MKDLKFDLKDIAVVPAVVSDINSRSECNTFYEGHLPLITAPMDTVICEKNVRTYAKNGIVPCMPRGEYYITDDFSFQSFGLAEIEMDLEILKSGNFDSIDSVKYPFWDFKYVLIDIANGHMKRLVDVIKEMKELKPKIQIMAGNVAHPLTYKNLALSGADYVRCSIGTGAGCTTAANVAINYPIGSLISECYAIKKEGELDCKIVADGGMQGYDDIIKALALGADYVMIGSLFNKTMQSSGSNHLWGIKLNFHVAKKLWKWGLPIKKKYRGMSTKAVQRKWGKAKLVTAEGITKYQKVEYNLSSWVENFKDYLKSNMSYCGDRDLKDFMGEVEWVFITNNALKRFQK